MDMNAKISDKTLAGMLESAAIDSASAECVKWRNPVRRYAAGMLKGAEKDSAESHMKACASCRLFLLHCVEMNGRLLSAAGKKTGFPPRGEAAPESEYASYKLEAEKLLEAGDEKGYRKAIRKCREALVAELVSMWIRSAEAVPEGELDRYFPGLAEKGPVSAGKFKCALKIAGERAKC